MQSNLKNRLRIAVYLILILLAVIFLIKGTNNFSREYIWQDVMKNLSTELMGAVLVILFVEFFFIWKNEEDNKMDRLNRFLTKIEKEEFSTVFKTTNKYNHEFYKYFDERIRAANYDIYLTGEGFGGNSDEGKKIAENYVSSFDFALRKGVNVVRIQTKSCISEFWNKQLKKLLKNHPKNFHLYLSNNTDDKGSLCSIDYSDEINNVSEFMLSVPRTIGVAESKLAGLAVFIDKDKQLATDIKNIIHGESKDIRSSLKITLKNFDIHMNDNNLYFAYGSNILESRIKKRCPSARRVEQKVYVDDYKLVFDRLGDYGKSGGVASIIPSLGSRVYGNVYMISNDDLLELDKIEKGPKGNSYYERKIAVKTMENQFLECQSYFSYPQGSFKPTEKYLKYIIDGAIESDFPSEYIENLKQIETVDLK